MRGVILVGVGRNLNRAIRTCFSFGVYDVYCIDCAGQAKGSLFAARDVRLHQITSLAGFNLETVLALEITKSLPALGGADLRGIEYVALGGETVTLRRSDFPRMARIPTPNRLCLTTEAALAVVLYQIGGGYRD